MIFENLLINNFGVYCGKQNFDLTTKAKKPVILTKVGEEILKQAKSIISESKRMEDIIAQEKGFIGGEFNLGIVPKR